MHTDDESNTNLQAFTPQVTRFAPKFLYPWKSGESVVKLIGCIARCRLNCKSACD